MIHSKVNYYKKIFQLTIILIAGITVIQLFGKAHLYVSLFLFIAFETYFLNKSMIYSISWDSENLKIVYYRMLKRNEIISPIETIKILKDYDISFRSSSKKTTILIYTDKKKFRINKLDGFKEDELVTFYEDVIKLKGSKL